MQEQIEREAIAISVKASRLTAQTLAKTLRAVGRKIKMECHKAKTPHGKQSVKKLMNHNCPTSTIPIEGDKGLFEKIARKWHVDYAFYRTGRGKHLLLFKSGQADAITAAFSEYSSRVIRRGRDNRPPVREEMNRAAERAAKEKPKHRERSRAREDVRE